MLFARVVVINGNAIFRFQTISYLIDSFTSFFWQSLRLPGLISSVMLDYEINALDFNLSSEVC